MVTETLAVTPDNFSDMFVNACPICNDQREKHVHCKINLIYQTVYDLVECENCGVIYCNPMPTIAELETFYNASYYNMERHREEGKGMAFAGRLTRWKHTGKFLDVGCATGFFINGIRNHSAWEVYGTDFGESAVRYAHDTLGLNVRHGDLADAQFPDAFFDYVHVNNVLEHVLNPRPLLQECRRIVKPGGIFFLSVPNGFNDSLDLIDFFHEENMPARSKNGHIFFFRDQTLHKLFDEIGFTVERQATYSLKRGMRSIGYLPRKPDWKTDLYPRTSPEKTVSSEVNVPSEPKKHSDVYYKFRLLQGEVLQIPGLHKFGLDFMFILRPKL